MSDQSWRVMQGTHHMLEAAESYATPDLFYLPRITRHFRASRRSRSITNVVEHQYPGYAFALIGDDTALQIRQRFHVTQMRTWDRSLAYVTREHVEFARHVELITQRRPRSPASLPQVRVGDTVVAALGHVTEIRGVVVSLRDGVAMVHREGWTLSVRVSQKLLRVVQ